MAWEKCGVVQSSVEMIGGGIGGNMVHNSPLEWARVRCPGLELVACSDDAGTARKGESIGYVYEHAYVPTKSRDMVR